MNFRDLTVGIVSYKSEKVIFNCLNSIRKIKNIIIIDNSHDINLKKKVKKKFPNVKFIISSKNLGFGYGNNIIIKNCKTKYLFLLSPDTVLHKNCETELMKALKILNNNFSIIAPIANNNFGNIKKLRTEKKNLVEVDYVKGFAMLLNVKEIKRVGLFDENIFLYLEDIDLCKRLINIGQKIYIHKSAKLKHIGAKSSNIGFEYEKLRNWHWMWSRVYYDKKFKNLIYVYLKYFFKLISNLFKLLLFMIFSNNKKFTITYLRCSGIFNSLTGKKSWYRPSLNKLMTRKTY